MPPENFPTVLEAFGLGPISCQIGQFIRYEWKRKAKGHRSCLDPAIDDCDWSPMMFKARFIEGLPYLDEQNEAENYCIDYTNDKFTTPPGDAREDRRGDEGPQALPEKDDAKRQGQGLRKGLDRRRPLR